MKTITIILTFDQARYLLNNLPIGAAIKMSVKDCNKILDEKYSTNEIKKITYAKSKNPFSK